jgi:signal transduction histidine kinase
MADSSSQLANFLLPVTDVDRLNKLYEYNILDTHQEDTFDKIASLASQVFETPNAFITFVDKDRVFFKSNISNFVADTTSIEKNPFALATIKDDFTVYYDTFDDHYLRDSPLVRDAGGIRFYAAAPLKTPEGYLIGTLCVADSAPRDNTITSKQFEMLKSLSEIIINELESRLRYHNLLKAQDELMNITLHEIKNPLATIKLATDVLNKDASKSEKMAQMIRQGVARIQTKLQDILSHSEMEEDQLKLSVQETDLTEIFSTLIKNFELQAGRKNQSIILEYEGLLPKVPVDRKKISDVFHNLLSNALKYSFYNTTITVVVKRGINAIEIEFRDQGQGLDKADTEKLFMRFAKLSAKPTGKETSTGLGLFICKSLIELHRGKIYAKSDGKNKGSSFFISLPMVYEIEKEPELKGL